MTAPFRTSAESWVPWCEAHETHSGSVVLLGDLAYKVKKPVALGFLDFTDLEVRRRICRREVELNRRLAPDVYLGVGSLEGPGPERAEPVIVMRRMPDDLRLTRLVRSGRLVADEVRSIARQVAAFHARARTGPEVIRRGTRDALRARWDANLAQARASNLDPASLDEIQSLVHRFVDGRNALFEDRIRRGAVVDGHGDLTPDDVFCLLDGPRLLDCLEFDDALRYVDRLDDIAFLAMGLAELGAVDAARTLVETWAEYLDDPAPPSLVHHFIAYRAFVRAKVGCLPGARGGSGRYVETTLAHLRGGAVKLVLVGGPPASGKTTLSGSLGDRLGMVVLSSDRVRKELAGIDPLTHLTTGFESGIYTPRHTTATYDELLGRARRLLGRGESVVLDATWTSTEARRKAAALASETSSDLVELRCEVDESIARDRIRARESLSDADETVAARLRDAAGCWPTSSAVDTSTDPALSVDRACALVRPHPGPGEVLRRRPLLPAD